MGSTATSTITALFGNTYDLAILIDGLRKVSGYLPLLKVTTVSGKVRTKDKICALKDSPMELLVLG
jgi:hypothetical protein